MSDAERLKALVKCLRRPVMRGWLSLAGADAALILATAHSDIPDDDFLTVWSTLRSEMFADAGCAS